MADGEITVDQMYSIENRGHQMGFLKKFMMENAGAAATRRLIERHGIGGSVASRRVLVFAGMGNNGGDGMVMARHLAGHGAQVTVRLLGDADKIKTEEARWNWSLLEKMPSVRLVEGGDYDAGTGCGTTTATATSSGGDDSDKPPEIIVDAILGTGISGELREPHVSAIEYINSTPCVKIAVDVPSGMDPQTGKTANVVTKCDLTVTFHRMKKGIPLRGDLTGNLYVERIGIPPEAEEGIL